MILVRNCVICVYDSTHDPELTLDSDGICNYCKAYFANLPKRTENLGIDGWIASLKVRLGRKPNLLGNYDCVIGLSGGVDSSYLAHVLAKSNLRVLAVHLDNGWNSPIATSNIEKLVNKLGMDFRTYVIDWNEFREIQRAFLLSSTPDGEIPTDHAIQAILWKTASNENIKQIFSGMNFRTESTEVPNFWSYGHSDYRYIKAIIQNFSTCRISTYPFFTLRNLLYWSLIKRIKVESPLNRIEYSRSAALEILKTNYDYEEYGGKHHESIYTRFYQGYVLPKKFNIDKRVAHLSDLVRSGEINREHAIIELSKPSYPLAIQLDDLEYICKKLQFSQAEFLEVLEAPQRSHNHFANNKKMISYLKIFVNLCRRLGLYPK